MHHHHHHHKPPPPPACPWDSCFLRCRSPPIKSYFPHCPPPPSRLAIPFLRRQAANFSIACSTVKRSVVSVCSQSERAENIKSWSRLWINASLFPCCKSESQSVWTFSVLAQTARLLALLFCESRRRTKRHTNCGLCSGFTNAANALEFVQHFVSFGFSTLKHYSLPVVPSWQENNFQNKSLLKFLDVSR